MEVFGKEWERILKSPSNYSLLAIEKALDQATLKEAIGAIPVVVRWISRLKEVPGTEGVLKDWRFLMYRMFDRLLRQGPNAAQLESLAVQSKRIHALFYDDREVPSVLCLKIKEYRLGL